MSVNDDSSRQGFRVRHDAASGITTFSSGRDHQAERSFAERYRGTPYATPVEMPPQDEAPMARGRLFVLVSGAALIVLLAIVALGGGV